MVSIRQKKPSIKVNKKTRRGRGKQNKIFEETFSIWGNNANGLKAKISSLKANIEHFQTPSCITIQETKLRQANSIKLKGYKIFEKIINGFGGGLLTAVVEDLEPVLISDGDEESEVLVVQMKVGKQNIRLINSYGPQEDEDWPKKVLFWNTLEKEIISALDESCFILIQMDANAKVGAEVLKGDPNKQSVNGKLLMELLKRHNLNLLNASDSCQGVITRHRKTLNGDEKSVLDYVIICGGLLNHFQKMIIDEDRLHTLTKYASTKGVQHKIESDHNPLFCQFSIKYKKESIKRERTSYYNFKNCENQEKFFLKPTIQVI